MPAGYRLLEVSYIGYQTEEVNIENKSKIEVRLKQNTKLLEEVVVTGMKRPLICRDMAMSKATVHAYDSNTVKIKSNANNQIAIQNKSLNGFNGIAAGAIISSREGNNEPEFESNSNNESYSGLTENNFIETNKENTSTFWHRCGQGFLQQYSAIY